MSIKTVHFALNLPDCGHIREFDPDVFRERSIATGDHCFGCAAGRGSSCGGTLI
ncbi:MAG: DUF3641 domain-containing protein [Planctomycetota bacterium]|nr:DUF3641 domain-containing protein [Planctomycetota bacterium]